MMEGHIPHTEEEPKDGATRGAPINSGKERSQLQVHYSSAVALINYSTVQYSTVHESANHTSTFLKVSEKM